MSAPSTARPSGNATIRVGRNHFERPSGAPFLWLADTWWFCPSALCPIDGSSNPAIASMFRALVDRRAAQGFNVIQMAFIGPNGAMEAANARIPAERRAAYWRSVERYVAYANERGLAVAIGVGFHRGLDTVSADELKFVWRDLVATLGAHGVVWFIAGEYNLDASPERIRKVLELARFVRSIDTHRRPMTLHPAVWTGVDPNLQSAEWADFVMVQGGHGALPPVEAYQPVVQGARRLPVVESECRYEGIFGTVTADDARLCMVRAIQAGAIGYTYGAHGLWYPKQGDSDQTFRDYGPARPWWEALELPGAEVVGQMKRFFERERWWEMPSRPGVLFPPDTASGGPRPLVRMGADRALVWFPREVGAESAFSLMGLAPGETFEYRWAKGDAPEEIVGSGVLRGQDRVTRLPQRPAAGEWFLMIRRSTSTH